MKYINYIVFFLIIVCLAACSSNRVVCPKPGYNSQLQSAGGGLKMKKEKNRYDKEGRIKK